jgi:putative lipoprotein
LAVAVSSCAHVSEDTTTSPSLSLSGTEWHIVEAGGTPVADPSETEFQLHSSGSLEGSTGCNNFTGSATVTGMNLAISPLATTRKACTPPLQTQETAILSALQSVTSFGPADGSRVNLLDRGGKIVIRLARD